MASYSPAYDYSKPSLRDTLLASLRDIPGARSFHLHVLISAPVLHRGLFKYSTSRLRNYAQDILVLCSERIHSSASASQPDANEAGEQFRPNSSPVVTPHVLIAAIEATLYSIRSANSCILYVRKVDSTGYSQGPSPTATLVRAFLKYYADPKTSPANYVWIQLFASARGEYLFPNSEQHKGKHLLGDVQLCVWWKRILSDVSSDLLNENVNGANPSTESSPPRSSGLQTRTCPLYRVYVEAYYTLPGFGQSEAEHALDIPSYASNIAWTYGYPYTRERTPLPYDRLTRGIYIGDLIPYFGDDPKSRLLDEIAHMACADGEPEVREHVKLVSPIDYTGHKSDKGQGKRRKRERERSEKLDKVTLDEFWERLASLPECVAGTVTGFFTLIIWTEVEDTFEQASISHALRGPQEQLEQVPLHIYKQILTILTTEIDYSTAEQAVKATETIENTIEQLCKGFSFPLTPGHIPNVAHPDWSG